MKALSAQQYQFNRLTWIFVSLITIATGAWLWMEEIRLVAPPLLPIMCLLLYALGFFYRHYRNEPNIYLFTQLAMQLGIGSTALCVLSYLTASWNYPLLDAQFIQADKLFLFDWLSWANGLNQYPIIARTLSIAYDVCAPQFIILLFTLFLYGHTAQMQRFNFIFLYSALWVVILAGLFPAIGGHLYYNPDMSLWPNLKPAAARLHEEVLYAMRSGSMKEISLLDPRGIITFPSFHAAIAVMVIYASWPILWLRVLAVVVNVTVIISTPFDGGHYLVDVLAGIVITLHAIWLSKKLLTPKRSD